MVNALITKLRNIEKEIRLLVATRNSVKVFDLQGLYIVFITLDSVLV